MPGLHHERVQLHGFRARYDQALYEPFTIGELEFTLFEVTHPPIDIACGMRIRHNGKTVIFTGDTNLTSRRKAWR